jgi:hypothetical protein
VSFEPRARPAERPDATLTAPQWLDAAERAEAAGDWREGLRCRHRALVARLVEEGVVDDVAGRTTGEYRREVGRALPGAAGEFAGATELFERAWYGAAATGPEERARFGALAEQVLERVGR